VTRSPRSLAHGIAAGGLAAGVLDIADAILFHGARGVAPIRILQAIASGVLGRDAFTEGAATAALGLALHFLIALAAAAVYGLASRRWTLLVARPWLAGPIFGLGVYAVMHYVVLPLSRFRAGPPPPAGSVDWGLVNLLAAHIFCVGLPIALAARWARGPQVPI
jgi:hypothetical protein